MYDDDDDSVLIKAIFKEHLYPWIALLNHFGKEGEKVWTAVIETCIGGFLSPVDLKY